MDKSFLASNLFSAAAFTVVVVSVMAGCYRSNISVGIILIMWTVNGFIQGILFERRQRNKFDKKVIDSFMKEIEKEMEDKKKDGQL